MHQFFTLVVPLLFSMSSLSGLKSIPFYACLGGLSLVGWASSPKSSKKILAVKDLSSFPVATIATFRVYILLFTMVAILAVDFR